MRIVGVVAADESVSLKVKEGRIECQIWNIALVLYQVSVFFFLGIFFALPLISLLEPLLLLFVIVVVFVVHVVC